MTKFMECCAVKKQLPEASPSIHLTCHGSSQGKTSMGVLFNVKCSRLQSKYLLNNFWLFSAPFWHINYKFTNFEEIPIDTIRCLNITPLQHSCWESTVCISSCCCCYGLIFCTKHVHIVGQKLPRNRCCKVSETQVNLGLGWPILFENVCNSILNHGIL